MEVIDKQREDDTQSVYGLDRINDKGIRLRTPESGLDNLVLETHLGPSVLKLCEGFTKTPTCDFYLLVTQNKNKINT